MQKSEPIDEKKHVTYLDGWRGIAILLVLFAHFYGFVYNVGALGVEFFFVLSGLLMGRILFIDKVPIGTFYRNRIARIFPVFYLYIIVLSVLAWRYHYSIDASDIIFSSLFLRTYFGDKSVWDENTLPVSHLWSLSVEEHCYIVLSLISLFALAKGSRWAKIMVTGCVFGCLAFFGIYKIFPPESLSPYVLRSEYAGFAILVSTAIFLWLKRYRFAVPSLVPLASLAAALWVGTHAQHKFTLYIAPPFLMAVSVNTLEYTPAWFKSVLSNRLLVWFGVCSYSIYLWQQLFFYLVEYHDPSIRIMGLMMGIAIGALSYYFYEVPMRRWIRGIHVGKPPARLVAATAEAV